MSWFAPAVCLMIFGDISSQYPNLVAYLRGLNRSQTRAARMARHYTAIGVASVCTLVIWAVSGPIGGAVALAATAAFGGYLVKVERERAADPERKVRDAALETVFALRQMLDYQRLHRDFSPATLQVLEQVARLRNEIYATLDTPFWHAHNLPEVYQRIRRQALDASDQSMIDAIGQYRSVLPNRIEERKVMDYIGEALESTIFSGRKLPKLPELGIHHVIEIGKKLQILREELDKASAEAVLNPGVPREAVPGGLVDVALQELGSLREAESELERELNRPTN